MRRLLTALLLGFALSAPGAVSAQVLPPAGVGGCTFLGISRDMRLAVMGAYVEGGSAAIAGVRNLRREVAGPARRCSGGGDINTNDALLAAFMSTVIKSVNALKLSNADIGQARLDTAWSQASEADRAPFIAHAQPFFDGQPAPAMTAQAADALLPTLALTTPPSAETREDILHYFQAVALNEMAEARLAKR